MLRDPAAPLVDPNRDSVPVLGYYAAAFASQLVGLRGTTDELAALARRYRAAYSATPSPRPPDASAAANHWRRRPLAEHSGERRAQMRERLLRTYAQTVEILCAPLTRRGLPRRWSE